MTDNDLLHALRALAAATPGFDDPAMEERLRAAFAEHRAARTAHARHMGVWWAAAAALVLSCSTGLWQLVQSRSAGAPASPPATIVLDFFPLPGAGALPEFERGDIVRIEVPIASLPAYGFDIVPDAAPALIPADLLIGQDGAPRAIRLASDRFD